ncbi:hypothetical protein DPMN_051744 [Dreissena polymorpha]|uniref:Uncharacterized protein n=1 Tax=Dreissena polymorpha TaxID=45954 RepID=A0A9D4HP65_DREPO|nr:hypothetical protein DPMN_051744 [Dreissena polymorpha]
MLCLNYLKHMSELRLTILIQGHVLVLTPVNLNPALHVYVATEVCRVPVVETAPLVGLVRVPQSTTK